MGSLRINLSARPFSNRRIFWLAVLLAASTGALGLLTISQAKNRDLERIAEMEIRIRATKGKVEAIRNQVEALRAQQSLAVLSQQEALRLAAARHLLGARSFAWDRMIGDIERFVPDDTRITGIKVGRIDQTPQGISAEVDLTALGKSAAQLTDMMARLEKSGGVFKVGDVAQGAAVDTGETPFTIALVYWPERGGAE